MTKPHRSTPEHWATVERYAQQVSSTDDCLLELRSRVEALEAGATCPHVVTSDEGTSCCNLAVNTQDKLDRLIEMDHAAPKPPSLKKQALEQLNGIAAVFRVSHGGDLVCDTIRRALEALPDD